MVIGFFLMMTLILAIIYTYIWYRLIRPAALTGWRKWLSVALLIPFPLIMPISFLLRRITQNYFINDLVNWAGFIGFGFISLLFAGLIIRDMVLIIVFIIKKLSYLLKQKTSGWRAQKDFDPQRRLFLLNATNVGIIGAAALLTGYGIYEARRRAILEEITVPIANLPAKFEGYRIAQFSDIHAGATIRRGFIESVVNDLSQLNVDAIVFTGDMVDGSVPHLKNDVAPFADISAPDGVYFVTGNHEYYSGVEPWIEEMDRLGFTVLINEHRQIERDQEKLVIAGVTDYRAGSHLAQHETDPFKAIAGVDNQVIKILLAHQPKSIYKAAEAGYDLQLSGHTHGGQYIPWNFVVTLDQPFISGLHKYKNTSIYVNRGTGYWGPPLRVGIPSEITLIKLVRQV